MIRRTVLLSLILLAGCLTFLPAPLAQTVDLFGDRLRLGAETTPGNVPLGQRVRARYEIAAGDTGTLIGHTFTTSTDIAVVGPQALEGYTYMDHPSGTVTLAIATIGNVEHDGVGLVAAGRGISAAVFTSNTGNMTDAIGVEVTSIGRGASTGTTTNGYGLRVGTFLAGVTNEWGVYVTDVDARNFFGGELLLGDPTDNTGMTDGLTINMGPADDEIFALKSSDVAHGMTALTETNTFALMRKGSITEGGVSFQGYSEGTNALINTGFITTVTTTKTTASAAAIQLDTQLRSGTGSIALTANANLVSISNATTRRFLFDVEGELHSIGTTSTDIFGNGEWFLNDTVNTDTTLGLTLNMGANDDVIFAMKSSDVAHGITALAETDTWGQLRKSSAADGGIAIQGFSDGDQGINVTGLVNTVDTGKGDADSASILLTSQFRSGTGVTSMTANANMVVIRNAGVNTAIFDAEGTLYLRQGGNDDQILNLVSSDVAHGMTILAETDVFGLMRKVSAAQGGVSFQGYTEGNNAFQLVGNVTTEDATRSTSATAPIILSTGLRNGTSTDPMSADRNLVVIRTGGATTRFIFDSDGDSHQDVGTAWTNFDGQDDVATLNALAYHVSRPGDPWRDSIRESFGASLDGMMTRQEMTDLKLVSFNEDGHHFVNMSKLTMLHTGALRQAGLERARLTRLIVTLQDGLQQAQAQIAQLVAHPQTVAAR